MSRRPYAVITDLDNTLYDWVEMWYQSFTPMVDYLISVSNIPREQLLDEIRTVHKRHGTSEYAFVAYELPTLRKQFSDVAFTHIAETAYQIRKEACDRTLQLYPGVLDTLNYLRQQQVLIVGYTESMAFYTTQRVLALGLDSLLDYLYSPRDHAIPRNHSFEKLTGSSQSLYKKTIHRNTPVGELKPNPRLLRDIIQDIGAQPEQVVYVGDSPLKDVIMAQDAGIVDVLAAYGKAQDRAAYDLLRRVTHWTDEDVARERALLMRGEIKPTYVLRQQFSELLDLFEFTAFPETHSNKTSAKASSSCTHVATYHLKDEA